MSTFNTTNIESTSNGAPNFSQGLNVGGSSITTLITMTEYYSQAEEPSSPANGAVWWDGTDAYQYVGGAWRILSVTPPPTWYGDRGLFGGGSYLGTTTNAIQYITISTPSNTTDFGDLTVARDRLAACSNKSRGLFAGGLTSPGNLSNTIDYVTVGTLGNATDFGDLSGLRSGLAACSDGVSGLFAGGSYFATDFDTIEYVSISTASNTTDFGDLTVARDYLSGCSDATRGVFAGGTSGSGPSTIYENIIDYVTIAAPSNATDFGDLTLGRSSLGACSNKTRGLFGGGDEDGSRNVIDYITIATPGNATDFGDLTNNRRALSAVSNGTYAAFSGGVQDNRIDYVTIATPGNAVDFGDLTGTLGFNAAASGD